MDTFVTIVTAMIQKAIQTEDGSSIWNAFGSFSPLDSAIQCVAADHQNVIG